ncbi:MAG: NUDIX hydrolase [Desulfosarcina sp.]
MSQAVSNHSTLIRKGRVFELYAESVTLPNGVTVEMDIVRHPGAAAIVPMLDDRTILLLKQYRHAVGGFIWEIPAGTLESGETVRRCAERELTEETGYRARDVQPIGVITPLPAYSDERIHLFLATGLTRAQQHLDADELIDVHRFEWDRAREMVAGGEIQDAKTITGLYLAEAWLARIGRRRP